MSTQPNTIIPEHPNIFVEDVVVAPSKVGLVQRVPWIDDEDDNNDNDNFELMKEPKTTKSGPPSLFSEEETRMIFGDLDSTTTKTKALDQDHVEVFWYPEGKLSIDPHASLKIIDRRFLEGDTVYLSSQPQSTQTQLGKVIEVTKRLDVWFKDGTVRYDVPSNLFYPVCRVREGVKVLLGGWVGEIIACTFDIEVQFGDGRICLIEEADYNDLIKEDVRYYSDIEFHAGQIVFVKNNLLQTAHWITGQNNPIESAGEGIPYLLLFIIYFLISIYFLYYK